MTLLQKFNRIVGYAVIEILLLLSHQLSAHTKKKEVFWLLFGIENDDVLLIWLWFEIIFDDMLIMLFLM